jgi:hypothetical protein
MKRYQVAAALASCFFLALTGCENPVVLHVHINSTSDPTLNEAHASGLKKGSVVTWTDSQQAFTVHFTSPTSPCDTAGTGSGGANYYPSSTVAPYTVTCTIKNDPSPQSPIQYTYLIDGSSGQIQGPAAGPSPVRPQQPPPQPPNGSDHCPGCIIDN